MAFPVQPAFFFKTTLEVCYQLNIFGNEKFVGFGGFCDDKCSPLKRRTCDEILDVTG